MIRLLIIYTTLVMVYLAGCTTIGPQAIARDRFRYTDAISDSWNMNLKR
jgi:hypothetical protein